jgi:hypothetical protein
MPYPGLDNDRFVGCVVPERLRAMWKIVRSADRKALPEALAEISTIDLCHYDSDKSYAGRRWAYGLLWNALRPGGIFMSDDIGDNMAFHDFCLSVRLDPIVVRYDDKYCGMIVKPQA